MVRPTRSLALMGGRPVGERPWGRSTPQARRSVRPSIPGLCPPAAPYSIWRKGARHPRRSQSRML